MKLRELERKLEELLQEGRKKITPVKVPDDFKSHAEKSKEQTLAMAKAAAAQNEKTAKKKDDGTLTSTSAMNLIRTILKKRKFTITKHDSGYKMVDMELNRTFKLKDSEVGFEYPLYWHLTFTAKWEHRAINIYGEAEMSMKDPQGHKTLYFFKKEPIFISDISSPKLGEHVIEFLKKTSGETEKEATKIIEKYEKENAKKPERQAAKMDFDIDLESLGEEERNEEVERIFSEEVFEYEYCEDEDDIEF